MTKPKDYDGSRRHVLDWTDSAGFLDTVREWGAPQGLAIPTDAVCMPSSPTHPGESRLFDAGSPFLDSDRKDKMRGWWLA
jgi:hypothetical protein